VAWNCASASRAYRARRPKTNSSFDFKRRLLVGGGMWVPVIRRGKGAGQRRYSERALASRRCTWVPKQRLWLGWTPHEADLSFLKREKTCARVVLKSRGGASMGPEISDRLHCCQISGQYGTAIQRD
jgi:hypothetical protein